MTGGRRTALWTVGAAFFLLLSGAPFEAAADELSVAVVVGSNHPPSAALESLRFADDDAVQHARTLQLLGAQVVLLTSPDPETRDLVPRLRPDGPATVAALRAAFERVTAWIAGARAANRKTRLYFVFAGHGDVSEGRPFLQLEDGRIWREDLADLLRQVSAHESHVVIDACHAATFVGDRGPGGERARTQAGFSSGARGVWPPRTGLLTARSSGEQAHEWAEFQAGIFSHEVRSALSGAADVNLDGRITYREIAAFVQRANETVPNRRYRPQLSMIAPDENPDATLAVLSAGPLVLELDLEPPGRVFVETGVGVRLVDLHPAAGVSVRLRLPVDEGELFVHHVPTRREFRLDAKPGHVRASTLAAAVPRVRPRGAAHEAFMLLFAHAFDPAAVVRFEIDRGREDDLRPLPDEARRRRWPPWLLMGSGAAALGTAGGLAFSAWRLSATGEDAPGASRPALNETIDARNQAAWVAGGVGIALVAAGVTWWLLQREPR